VKPAPSPPRGGGGAPPPDASPPPRIRLEAGKIHAAVEASEETLRAAGCYQCGGRVVKLGRAPIRTADGATVMAPRLLQVEAAHLREELGRMVGFDKFDKRVAEWVPADCPKDVPEMYLARPAWRLQVVYGIVTAPTLRPDGSLLDAPGYDAPTGLLYEPGGEAFPAVPATPDKADAQRALAHLRKLVETFPFVASADEAVALSAMLTGLVRPSLPTRPLHAYTAPAAGTGKSKLVDLVAIIATGRPAAVVAQARKDEENDKQLGASLLAGDAVISYDNCEYPLRGTLLCQVVSQQFVRVRILGQSVNVDTPSNAAIFATGSNLVLEGDITRRAVLCSLDAQVERPELREFASDPIAAARAGRGEYVAAGLTILRAYIMAGRPCPLPPLGGFFEWSRWVREALVWLGMTDPVETMQKVRGSDVALAAARAVVTQWAKVIGESRHRVREVIATAMTRPPFGDGYQYPELRDALLVIAGDAGPNGGINSQRLGRWLEKIKGRVIDGLRIVRDDDLGNTAAWRLEVVETP
jgi:hypothetical protein